MRPAFIFISLGPRMSQENQSRVRYQLKAEAIDVS